MVRKPVKERFEALCAPDPNSGCWVWLGAVNADGYGHFGVEPSWPVKAHRVSYELYKGAIPGGMIVRHKCDCPGCVNPDHLELGSHADNSADRAARNRTAIGERNGKRKLSAAQVALIKQQLRGGQSEREIARSHNVHHATINAIASGKTWVAVI